MISISSKSPRRGLPRSKFRFASGFTLAEMMVSVAILIAITSLVLSGQSTYTEGAALANLADDISFAVTRAQVYGVSVRQVTPGSDNFSSAYGVEFRLAGAGGSADAYIFFADTDGDEIYGGAWSCPIDGASECLEKTSMQYENRVSSLCLISTDDSESCDIGRVSVTFIRPDTQARFAFFDLSGSRIYPANVKGVLIKVASPGNLERSVAVYNTGYISAQ